MLSPTAAKAENLSSAFPEVAVGINPYFTSLSATLKYTAPTFADQYVILLFIVAE
ncbi:hypothetical protein [uncultured Pontibacter sp.]|uniref:hypothetical protein n=1 Tax=uncultured Pontibacter sp. TaxID=453356 RepID=UPI00260D7E79|nr:hypothetical protein [uncultured Pontibacter sp.]